MLLENQLKSNLEKYINEAKTAKQNNDAEAATKAMQKAWDTIPDTKNEYDESYRVAKYFVQLNLFFKRNEDAKKWAVKIYECDINRIETGEREHIHGRVELALNNIEKAKELFKIAYQKSEGREFTRNDSKYLQLIK